MSIPMPPQPPPLAPLLAPPPLPPPTPRLLDDNDDDDDADEGLRARCSVASKDSGVKLRPRLAKWPKKSASLGLKNKRAVPGEPFLAVRPIR